MKQILFLIFVSGFKLYAQLPFPAYSPPQQVPNVLNNVTNSGYNVGGVTYYGYSSETELTVAQNGPVVANDNSYVDYSSEYVVTLKPGFEVSNLGPISVVSANTNRYNRDNDINSFSTAIMSNHPNADVGAYERFEIGVDPGSAYLTSIDNFLNGGTGINPYDPAQIRFEVVVTYTSPTQVSPTIVLGVNSASFNGFYYKDFTVTNNSFAPINTPYPFRIRMALPWHFVDYATTPVVDVAVRMYINGVQTGGVFKNQITIHNTNKKGFLHINAYNKLYADRKAAYLGIGQSIGYAEEPAAYAYNHGSFETQRGYISDLAAKGGNFLRLRMDPWSNGVEWEEAGVYGSKRTYNDVAQRAENFDRQFHAWELDKTLELCETLDINMMLCLEQDQVLSDYDPYSHNHNYPYLWPSPGYTVTPRHPYAPLPGVNGNIRSVFTDQQARDYFKQRMYYVNARFGYSPAIGMYQLMNETDNIGVYGTDASGNMTHYNDDAGWQTDINRWHCEMASYLKNSYPYHITMTGYGAKPQPYDNSYACMDIESKNHYSSAYEQNYDGRNVVVTTQTKPFVYGELGTGCGDEDRCTDIPFHNAVWASVFRGHLINGLYWNDWQDRNNLGHRNNFTFMNIFFNTVDFENTAWYPGSEKEDGSGSSSYKEVVTCFMTDNTSNADKAIGFAQNYAYQSFTNGCSKLNLGPTCGEMASGAANVYANFPDPQINVGNLKQFTNYDITLYDAHTGAQLTPQNNKNTAFDGHLKFRVDLGWQDNNGIPPSVVFKIVRSNCSGCRTNNNESIIFNYTFQAEDTFNLSVPVDNGYSDIQWIGQDDDVISRNTELNYSYKNAGNYIIYTKFIDKDAKSFFVTNNIRITEKNEPIKHSIIISPNPGSGLFHINYNTLKDDVMVVAIYDSSGKLLMSQKPTESIDLSNFSDGLFLIIIIQKNGTTSTHRIIKN